MANFCGNCGSRLDPESGLCPQCNKEAIRERIVTTTVRKSRKGIIIVATIVAILILGALCAFFYPQGFFSPDHPFKAHIWKDATCEAPSVCEICDMTKGEALGHNPREPEIIKDILAAEIRTVETCDNCGKVLDSSSEPISTFLGDKEFALTPDQFVERYISILKGTLKDPSKVRYESREATYENDTTDDKLMYQIFYDGELWALLYCYDRNDELLSYGQKDKSHFWSVTLRAVANDEASLDDAFGLYEVLLGACDPLFPEEEKIQFSNKWEMWLRQATTTSGNRLLQSKNHILFMTELHPQGDGIYFYLTAFSTLDLNSVSGGATLNDFDVVIADVPNYNENEAMQAFSGTWDATYIILHYNGEPHYYTLDEGDDVTISFRKDNSAILTFNQFSAAEEAGLDLAEEWNDCPLQWYYLYDSGDTLYYVLNIPSMAETIPFQYDTDSQFDNTIRVCVGEGFYIGFEKR